MIEVVSLSDGHRADWEALFVGYNTFYGRTHPPAFYADAWERFRADDVLHVRGGLLDGRLVGIVHFLVHANTTGPDVCYLQDLFSAPEARGRGVGRTLIAEVVRWASERGCSRVYWMTHETNATARALYDRVAEHRGFIRYEIALPPSG